MPTIISAANRYITDGGLELRQFNLIRREKVLVVLESDKELVE